jgi:outer membrane lipoprotein-sorting protein
MNRIARAATLALLALALGQAAFAAEPDIPGIIAAIDRMANFRDVDFSCTYTMVSEKPGEDPEVFKVRVFRRDREEKFMILFLEPETQKGQGYLQIEDNLWFYDPESRKFNHSSFKENLSDSEAKNNDMRASSLTDDYAVQGYVEAVLGKYEAYVVTMAAKNDEVPYPTIKMWISKGDSLVLKIESYSLSNRLMRTSYYPSYVKIGDRYLPSRMLFVDELNTGEKTQATIKDPSVAALPDSVFTKAYLERVNK